MTSDEWLISLTIQDIARWQIDLATDTEPAKTRVVLPSLQRGAVWKPFQVESLWDSLLRGFPAGSFLMAPYMRKLGAKPMKHDQYKRKDRQPNYHLLDGQQRSNAIALAYLNPWVRNGRVPRGKDNITAMLWVDLEPPEDRDDRNYVMRVVTRSHPWGYRRSNGEERIEVKERRKAYETFIKCSPLSRETLLAPGNLHLKYVWPWDALAPVPLCFLIQAISELGTQFDQVGKRVLELCEFLPFWKCRSDIPSLRSAEKVLADIGSNPTPQTDRLLNAVARLIGPAGVAPYRIPAQIVPRELVGMSSDKLDRSDLSRGRDAVETLFIRINAGGVRLSGEELNYSILKSVWPRAEKLVDDLSSHLMPPARLVMLATRLLLSNDDNHKAKPPVAPDVSRFRNLIHDKGFNKKFVSFLRDGRMRRLLDDARWLLTVEPNGSVGIRLPPVLLADIARNSPDTFFLLLRWLDRMMENQKDPRKIPLKNQKLMLGSLTSLAWFAKEPSLCLESLWPRLQDALPKSLPSYFDKGVLRPCLRPKEGKLQLIPPIVPAVLRSGITVRMWGHGLLSRHTAAAWESWDWDNSFAEKQHPQDTILPWFRNMLSRAGADGDGQLTVSDLALTAWINFSSRLLGMKELVLYAQKDWLCRWFPNFDPASLDQLEDTDRPWDLDHIHPHKYVDNIRGGGHAIRIINKWHNSIGNLRAWPFELNRGDGESPPFRKLTLSDLPDQCTITRYDVRTDSELRNASVIRTGHKDWIKSTPNFDGFNSNYLRDYPEHRPHVLRAIVNRMQDLYAIWYRDYRVGELLRP